MNNKNILAILAVALVFGFALPSTTHALVNVQLEAGTKASTTANSGKLQVGGSAVTEIEFSTKSTTTASTTNSEESMVEVITDINQINTEADLKAYAAGRLVANEKIETIDFANTFVQISYKDKARLWGLIPITVTIKSKIDQEGKINVDYPWYWFMVSHESDVDLETSLNAAITPITSATTWDARQQAELATKLETALKANLE